MATPSTNFVDVEAPGGGVNNRFPYDANDTFFVDGPSDVAGFEAAVTPSGRIQVDFHPSVDLPRSFALTNDTDCTPSNLAELTTGGCSPRPAEVGRWCWAVGCADG